MIGVLAHRHRYSRTGLWPRRLWLAALLTLLLGWQAAAMRHALAHLGDADPDGPALPAHAVCVLCVAYAGADGALAAPPLVVDVVMDADKRIQEVAHTVKGCVLCQASASVIGAEAKGESAESLNAVREALHEPLDEESAIFASADHEAGDARRDVLQLLARLPDSQRLPIQYMKLEGRSVVEIATLTKMSESAVKVAVHRGLKKLALLIRDAS